MSKPIRMRSVVCGEYPNGYHWTPGEEKELDAAAVKDAPAWLSKVPAKKKAPKKADAPESTEG